MLEGSILKKLETAHQAVLPDDQGGIGRARPLSFGVYYKNTLVALCHALEDAILTATSKPLVLAAFQQGKWYFQEAERYQEIADKSRHVTILAAANTGFAEHKTSHRSNVTLVELDPTDPVAQEWHLMILSPTYTAMVLCQELSEADYGPGGLPTEDRERKFYGLWTFEPALVEEAVNLTISHLGRYNPPLQKTLQAQVQAIKTAPVDRPDDVHQIVSRVVDYLQTSEQTLNQEVPTYVLNPGGETALNHNLVSNELQAFLQMAQLMDLTDLKNPLAAAEVAALAEMMGQLLDLPSWQIHRLRLAGLLHRIAPYQDAESQLNPGTAPRYQAEAPSCPLSCSLVPGTQVLRLMPRLRAIATILTHQTEWWNGLGYPGGLAGDEIPLESRILALVTHGQQRVNQLKQSEVKTPEEAWVQVLAECQGQTSDRWDPKLVEALALLVSGMQQGLALPITSTKVTTGMWLLDSHAEMPLTHSFNEFDSSAQTSELPT
ncbi:MAG: DICT sensory domain-containing protein [Leptolyngbyaceae bacterium]|nr:DICT sensory domain-containing protein [Leptolyngbyaceae bacterium]